MGAAEVTPCCQPTKHHVIIPSKIAGTIMAEKKKGRDERRKIEEKGEEKKKKKMVYIIIPSLATA